MDSKNSIEEFLMTAITAVANADDKDGTADAICKTANTLRNVFNGIEAHKED